MVKLKMNWHLQVLFFPLLCNAFMVPSRLDSRLSSPYFSGIPIDHRSGSKSVNVFMQAANTCRVIDDICVKCAKPSPLVFQQPCGWLSDLETMKKTLWNLPIIAIVLASAFSCPESSFAVLSNEQRVVAEAWSIVDSTFVDRTFNDNDWLNIRQTLVKREYNSREAVRATHCILLSIFTTLVIRTRRTKPFQKKC